MVSGSSLSYVSPSQVFFFIGLPYSYYWALSLTLAENQIGTLLAWSLIAGNFAGMLLVLDFRIALVFHSKNPSCIHNAVILMGGCIIWKLQPCLEDDKIISEPFNYLIERDHDYLYLLHWESNTLRSSSSLWHHGSSVVWKANINSAKK